MKSFKQDEEHKSHGMIQVNRFSSNGATFFGSDISHSGGISITICEAAKQRGLSNDWYHSGKELIRIELSASQYVDAITSGMNTQGVPCTITRLNNERVEQINHIEDKKEIFSTEMKDTQNEFIDKISKIIENLNDGKGGKKKFEKVCFDLKNLAEHISDNSSFVVREFNAAMENTVSEAKHSISNYIDHKVHTLGIEAIRGELNGTTITKEIK